MISFMIILLFNVLTNVSLQNYPIVPDGSTAELSLLNYNVSNPEGESVEHTYTLLPNSSITVTISNIPGNAYFLVIQAHSFLQNITLSYDPVISPTRSIQGTNIGLWKAISVSDAKFNLFTGNSYENISIMLAVQAYGHQAPTPGGCNMELPVETAPFMQTAYNLDIVSVEFAAASMPPSMMAWMDGKKNQNCLPPDDHTVYRVHLPERDFTPRTYFTTLQRMMTLGRIKKHAHAVANKNGAPALRHIFAAYPGTGSAYAVVAQNASLPVVYVPSLSYACYPAPDNDTCAVLKTTFPKITCAVILFVGIFACLGAHSFFLIETMLLGILSGGLVFNILLTNYTDTSEIFLMSIIGGLFVGAMFALLWHCHSKPILSVILATSTLGYVVAAIVFTPLVDYVDLVNDINYWVPYCCVILVVPALLLSLAEKANILATSILGGYAAIIPLDYYLGSNLRFILLNSIRRATVPEFKWAIIDIPFQTTDVFLAGLWIMMAIAGYFSQSLLIKNKPPFPPPSYPKRLLRPRTLTERTPLIYSM